MATPVPRPFQKRVRLTKLQELKICEHRHDQQGATLAELATWAQKEFSLAIKPSKQLVSRAQRRLGLLSADCLRRRNARPRFQLLLDQSIVEYVKACEEMQLALSGAMVIARAKWVLHRLEIPPSAWPRLGKSWLRRLQRRYGIRWRRSYGEDGMVDLASVEGEIQKLRSLIRSYSYTDVYNMDETSCFYNNVPRGSLCINEAPSLKQDKSRLTLVVCTNVTGTDKMPLLFIGKFFKPRWIAKKPADTLYTSTNKDWMTTDTFQGWLRDVDASMRAQQRHILILVDNASSHCDDGVTLTNVCVAKLPANTTSKLQPLDQGIIYCIKRDVLRKKMEFAVDAVDVGVENPYKVGALKATECTQVAFV
ncbi:hypothetical protein PF011_g18352 [Phytophthora fragariae]|uniref:HTH CENPB-type domain-containing protein n=1 Tax=Phytophthora fragariae TaxID=53985 RepID=A0A6A3J707_9STRA|nr:hypothetical protein PF011_g18352 [Phytophthora fragariae]